MGIQSRKLFAKQQKQTFICPAEQLRIANLLGRRCARAGSQPLVDRLLGGSGLCSLFGGLVTQSLGWRYIFFASIVAALFGLALMRGVPESRTASKESYRFDFAGVISFMIAMVALQVVVTQGNKLGWTSPAALILIVVTLVAGFLFFRIEGSRVCCLRRFLTSLTRSTRRARFQLSA